MDIESILVKYPKRREFLLEILHEIQNNQPQQYLPEESIKSVSKYLGLTLSQVYGVIGYYSMLSINPRGKYIIYACKSPVCKLMGSTPLIDLLKTHLKIEINKTTPDGLFTIEETECIGRCDEAPSMIINQEYYGNLTPEKVISILSELKTQ